MSESCHQCLSTFRSIKSLEFHKKNNTSCYLFKNVLFTCLNCRYATRGIKNIEEHMRTCKQEPLDEESYLSEIQRFKMLLDLETMKSKLYAHLLEQNTNIKIGEFITENSDGIHVYTPTSSVIPVFIHNYAKTIPLNITITDDETEENKPIIQKKHQFRSLKKEIIIPEQPSEEEIQTSKQPDESLLELKERVEKACVELIYSLKDTRIYTKILNNIKKYRVDLFEKLTIEEYKQLILKHVNHITDVYKTKKYLDKKIVSVISKGLTPFEARIIEYGNYSEQSIDFEDITRLGTVMDNNRRLASYSEYVPFNIEEILGLFYNYGSVIFPVRQLIDKYLFNSYGYNTVIYVPLPKNTEKDHFSFYLLERVEKGRCYWAMNCRLDDLTDQISGSLLPYMINLFRKLYKHVFSDNDYRANFSNICPLMESDCEQLIKNIFVIGHHRRLCNLLRDRVTEKASYKPTDRDKFNLCGDDQLLRRKFQEKDDFDSVDLVKYMFDTITSEEAVDFYRSKND